MAIVFSVYRALPHAQARCLDERNIAAATAQFPTLSCIAAATALIHNAVLYYGCLSATSQRYPALRLRQR